MGNISRRGGGYFKAITWLCLAAMAIYFCYTSLQSSHVGCRFKVMLNCVPYSLLPKRLDGLKLDKNTYAYYVIRRFLLKIQSNFFELPHKIPVSETATKNDLEEKKENNFF